MYQLFRRLGLAVAVAACSVAAFQVAAIEGAQAADGGPYRLSFFHSKKCLDVPGDFNTQSTPLQHARLSPEAKKAFDVYPP